MRLRSESLEQVLYPDLPLEPHVEQLLPGGQRAVDQHLELVGQLVFDVLLDSPQHEWFENHVKATDLL